MLQAQLDDAGDIPFTFSPDVPVEKLHSEEAREQARLVVTKVRECHVEDIKAKLQLGYYKIIKPGFLGSRQS